MTNNTAALTLALSNATTTTGDARALYNAIEALAVAGEHALARALAALAGDARVSALMGALAREGDYEGGLTLAREGAADAVASTDCHYAEW